MQVETFEINETTSDGATDQLDDAAVAIIEKLGLSGQQSLIGRSGSDSVAVLPYQEMTEEERAVYEALFPAKPDVAEYAGGAIPLRVLQVAAYARDRGWFDRLQVWHKRTGSAKEDPLLVGVLAHPQHKTLDRQYFLLARWGDALKPYVELVAEAAVLARAHLKTCVAKCRADLEAAQAMAGAVADSVAVRWARSGPSMFNAEPPRS